MTSEPNAYERGELAFQHGLSKKDCPYKDTEPQYYEWHRGYLAKRYEASYQ